MGSLLSYGAGASEGLETLIDRMMAEDEGARRRRALDEEIRSNKAREALTGRQIDTTEGLRRATLDQTIANQKAIDEDRNLNRVRQTLNLQPIGAEIAPEVKSEQVKAGASPANYFSPILPGRSTPEGDMPNLEGASYWRGTPEQQRQQNTSPGMQRDTQLYKGKPVDVLIDTHTNKVYLQGGEDVTGQTEHYEKPPTTMFTPIQTGDAYGVFNRRTGTMKPMEGPGGGEVPLAVTSQTRAMAEGAKMVRPHIGELQSLATELDKRGMFGPFLGRVRDIMVKAGTTLDTGDPEQDAKGWQAVGSAIAGDPKLNSDRLAGQFAATLGLMTSGAGRVHGGARGGGSIQMLDYFKSLLSGTTTLPMFLGRLDALDSYMRTYAAGPNEPQGGGGGGDLYQEYLSRTKPK